MTSLHPLDWEILNATADDRENLEQIYHSVCFEFLPDAADGAGALRPLPESASLAEIADRLRTLVEGGLLAAVTDEGGRPASEVPSEEVVWKAWFAMTPEGRRLWAAADPADLMERK